jgi:mRNA-degrading endonuclease RelE of RelBE toxin-antitoxin system
MKTEKSKTYQVKLTPRQQEEVRELTGKDAETISLTVEELEERINPGIRLSN